jgi:hypothetical protein
MERISEIDLCDIELRALDKSLSDLVAMVVRFRMMRLMMPSACTLMSLFMTMALMAIFVAVALIALTTAAMVCFTTAE